jgi:hypothetical protein
VADLGLPATHLVLEFEQALLGDPLRGPARRLLTREAAFEELVVGELW